jgi:hypothetical protein
MATPWSQVIQSPDYQALPPDQQEAARQQYFSQVVAPQVGSDPDAVTQAKQQFDAQYGPQTPVGGVPTVQTDSSVQNGIPTVAYSPAANKDDPTSTAARLPGVLGTINDIGNDMGDAFVHNLAKPLVGIGQGIAHQVQGMVNSAPAMSSAGPVAQNIAGAVNTGASNLDNAVAANEKNYQATVPTNAASITGAVLGNILPYAIGGEVAAVPKMASVAGKIGMGALTGAAVGASQPVTTGSGPNAPDFATQKAQQIGAGMITGGAIPAITAIPGALVGTATPEVQALAQKAAGYGIDLNAPQISKSVPLKLANSTTAPIPFSGATAATEAQQGQFNNAVAQTIGLPQGTTKITPDVFNQAKQAIGQGYDDLAARNNLVIDPPTIGKIQHILGEAHTDGDPDAANAISNMTQEIIGKASQNGSVLTGPQFQSIDSRLGRLSANPAGGDKAYYAGQLQDALRQSMESGMTPADQAQSQLLRTQWRNALNLTPILTSGDGNVPPSRLLAAVANNRIGKTQLATGTRGDLGTLAQIGKQFMTDPVPNSQTALRNVGMDTLKGLGGVGAASVAGIPAMTALPAAAGTVIASRLIQSGLRSRALYNAVANLPAQQQGAVRAALGPYLSSQAAQNIGGFLDNSAPPTNNISAQANP